MTALDRHQTACLRRLARGLDAERAFEHQKYQIASPCPKAASFLSRPFDEMNINPSVLIGLIESAKHLGRAGDQPRLRRARQRCQRWPRDNELEMTFVLGPGI